MNRNPALLPTFILVGEGKCQAFAEEGREGESTACFERRTSRFRLVATIWSGLRNLSRGQTGFFRAKLSLRIWKTKESSLSRIGAQLRTVNSDLIARVDSGTFWIPLGWLARRIGFFGGIDCITDNYATLPRIVVRRLRASSAHDVYIRPQSRLEPQPLIPERAIRTRARPVCYAAHGSAIPAAVASVRPSSTLHTRATQDGQHHASQARSAHAVSAPLPRPESGTGGTQRRVSYRRRRCRADFTSIGRWPSPSPYGVRRARVQRKEGGEEGAEIERGGGVGVRDASGKWEAVGERTVAMIGRRAGHGWQRTIVQALELLLLALMTRRRGEGWGYPARFFGRSPRRCGRGRTLRRRRQQRSQLSPARGGDLRAANANESGEATYRSRIPSSRRESEEQGWKSILVGRENAGIACRAARGMRALQVMWARVRGAGRAGGTERGRDAYDEVERWLSASRAKSNIVVFVPFSRPPCLQRWTTLDYQCHCLPDPPYLSVPPGPHHTYRNPHLAFKYSSYSQKVLYKNFAYEEHSWKLSLACKIQRPRLPQRSGSCVKQRQEAQEMSSAVYTELQAKQRHSTVQAKFLTEESCCVPSIIFYGSEMGRVRIEKPTSNQPGSLKFEDSAPDSLEFERLEEQSAKPVIRLLFYRKPSCWNKLGASNYSGITASQKRTLSKSTAAAADDDRAAAGIHAALTNPLYEPIQVRLTVQRVHAPRRGVGVGHPSALELVPPRCDRGGAGVRGRRGRRWW
ncbi:hypothetical protein C8R47DRAFT_1280373 [Mycena vitilis]|nr:hypothetical protein C8R47DRAFT_1280373 [Mycena vitilis]